MAHAGATDLTSTPAQVPAGEAAVFLDFEGTLAGTNLVLVYAWYARHCGSLVGAAARTARLALELPAMAALDKVDRLLFARRLYAHYRGLSEDRLRCLAPLLYEQVIRPRVYAYTRTFLDAARRQGRRLVLVSGAPDFMLRPFVEEYGLDGLIASELEFVDGLCTGRALDPPVFGPNKAALMRRYARRHGLDLAASAAYSDSAHDLPMLSVVGRAGCINPDAALARAAAAYHWQILRFN